MKSAREGKTKRVQLDEHKPSVVSRGYQSYQGAEWGLGFIVPIPTPTQGERWTMNLKIPLQ